MVSIASVFMQIYCIRGRLWKTLSNFQLYLTRIAHESFFRQPLYMVTSKFELENGSHNMQIWSLSHRYSCRYIVYDVGFEKQCQTFNYTSPESPTNHFSVNIYTRYRPNLNKKMVVTSCKYGLYRIITHADILYKRRSLWRTMSNFNYTSPESPTNHFSVNLYTWSRPNLNKKMVVTSCQYGLYRIIIQADILYTTQALKNNVKLSIIPHPNRPRIISSVNIYTWSRPNLI